MFVALGGLVSTAARDTMFYTHQNKSLALEKMQEHVLRVVLALEPQVRGKVVSGGDYIAGPKLHASHTNEHNKSPK